MRLSELLGADVVDERGRSAGRVHDVRLIQDGPIIGGFGAGLRLDGLITGGRALGVRFGYARSVMKGPLLVKFIFERLLRDGRYVDWSRVTDVEPGRISISGSVEDLPMPEPVR